MFTKLRVIQFAREQNARFLEAFRQDRQPLRLFEKNARFTGSPCFQPLSSWMPGDDLSFSRITEVDGTLGPIGLPTRSPRPDGRVTTAMERAVGETALASGIQMILLATAVSGAPFLGLLGTVWGVMDTFTGVAEAGSRISAMAPGVSGALITTVTGFGRDPSDVRIQFSRHQYSRPDRGN